MSYELNRADIEGFAASIGANARQEGNELFFRFCPYCNGGEHRDKKTFSINVKTGTFKCFRASCDAHGHFVQLCRDFGYRLDFGDDDRRKYRTLPQNRTVVVRKPAVEYMQSRGISAAVCERYHITTRTDNDNILVFPFYDDKGELVFIKYRYIKPPEGFGKEYSEKNTKPILFGMDQCVDRSTLVITEGQIDSLSLAQAGIPNAVSVPTGAVGMTWIENCFDFVMSFKRLIIMGDNEHGSISLVERIAERIPKPISVVRREDYFGEKDANDILRKYGSETLVACIDRAAPIGTKRVKELADVRSVNLETMPKIRTGIKALDRLIGGMYYGQIILLTGKRGEGKSTFLSQLIANALDQDVSVFAYSGELTDYHFKRWLDMQLAGKTHIERVRANTATITTTSPMMWRCVYRNGTEVRRTSMTTPRYMIPMTTNARACSTRSRNASSARA